MLVDHPNATFTVEETGTRYSCPDCGAKGYNSISWPGLPPEWDKFCGVDKTVKA